MIQTAPEWLGTALVGAVLASLGYVGKQLVDWLGAVRQARRERRARLAGLLALLLGSDAIYNVQIDLRERLWAALDRRLPNSIKSEGFDARFAEAYPSMPPEERELHALIRGYTVGGIRPINDAVLEWLAKDSDFKVSRARGAEHVRLAKQLLALEAHLLMWRAKYQAWIPDSPAHALVYLVDEKKHGIGFPKGIEKTIASILEAPSLDALRALAAQEQT